MAFWNRKKQPEQRATVEDPTVPISSAAIIEMLGFDSLSATGVNVTIENALGIPAVWAAVNFIAGTMATLPLHLYKRTDKGRERVKGGLATILHDAANDEMTSFDWRKYSFERTLTGGRSVTFIERNTAGRVINLWPLNPAHTEVKKKNGRKVFIYKENGQTFTYSANEIIDLPFMLKADMVTALSPVLTNKDTIGLGIAATQYGSKLFQNGGVPPFMITGNFVSGAGLNRASDDLQAAIKKASKENRQALALPTGHEIKSIGIDPEKFQLVELKRLLIEEYARIWSLPPVFIQDLTHGTFSNTEQQDLQLVKHLISRWAKQHEQEMNLKLFGKNNQQQYVEYNLDGLQRGDFASRMSGYATAIQNAILKPNEARAQENRPDDPEGDKLMIQGATVPIGSQPAQQPAAQTAPEEEDEA